MIDVVAQVPKEKFDLARTLRMGEWRVVWEVIVLGRADAAFDAMRQNAAMGWMSGYKKIVEEFRRRMGIADRMAPLRCLRETRDFAAGLKKGAHVRSRANSAAANTKKTVSGTDLRMPGRIDPETGSRCTAGRT